MSQHVYEGAFRHTYEDLQQDGVVYVATTTGSAAQELYHGDLTMRSEDTSGHVVVMDYQYQNGIMQEAWVDPSTGDTCHAKRVETWPDGSEEVEYIFFGDGDMVHYVTGFLGY